MARIVVLSDNQAAVSFLAEHGFAAWVETAGGAILFDTGQGQTLLHNARRCDVDLAQARAVVISHGHHDHTGGPFFTDARCEQPDRLWDDQGLLVRCSAGTVVLTGCAH